MPRTPVRVGFAVGRLRQRQVDRAAILRRRRPIHRRPHQRMPERHSLADRQQPVRLSGLRGLRSDPEPLGRAPQQQRIADRLRRRDQQQTPRVIRERLESSDEALLDPSCQRLRAEEAEPARQLRRRQPPRQLEQRQRIPPHFGDDPVPDSLIQFEPHCRAQQRAGVAVAHAVHLQLGHVSKLLARLARAEHEPHRLRQQATCNKRQGQRRGLIQPLRVIDDTQQRTLLGHLREQTQHRQPDEKPIRGFTGAQPEHDLHGLLLRRGEPLEPVEQRPAQLMQTGERQLHVRLHPHRPDEGQVRRRRDQVFQQRRLPDPSLAPQHERPALAAADRRDQVVQQRALASPAAQARLPPRSGKAVFHRPMLAARPGRRPGHRPGDTRRNGPSEAGCWPAHHDSRKERRCAPISRPAGRSRTTSYPITRAFLEGSASWEFRTPACQSWAARAVVLDTPTRRSTRQRTAPPGSLELLTV
jgi:hypothetical protein